jgi:hypothetical protein
VLLLLLRGEILPPTFFKLIRVVELLVADRCRQSRNPKMLPEMDIKGLTRLWAALRRRETMPESGIFSGWALSAEYTSASTA